MANVYSARLLAWEADESPPPYESPTGFLTVVRCVDVWSGGGAMINFQLAINELAKFWAGQFTIEAIAQVAQWRGHQVVYPGEFLVFSSDGALDGAISGYQLALP